MKLLFKKIANSKIGVFLRNFFNYKPLIININKVKNFYTVSDAFLWRTDNQFKTSFIFTDLLKFYFDNTKSSVEVLFFDKNNKFLKKLDLHNIELSSEILIDKNFFDLKLEDYGIFYIFHNSHKNISDSIRNSCYLGFSKNENAYSFVHGNVPVAYRSYADKKIHSGIVEKSIFQNQVYKIQNYLKQYDHSEVFVNNPTKYKIDFMLNKKYYSLGPSCSIILNISDQNTIEIVSKCMLLRPILFNYKNGFLDVHHA